MMMAWKVSGLSHRPGDHRLAARLDALGNGDFAFARQQLDLPHLAQIHAHRIIGAVSRKLRRLNLDDGGLRTLLAFDLGDDVFGFLFAFDNRDAHVGQHRIDVLDLVRGHFLRWHHRVEFVERHIALGLRRLDQPLDGGIGKIKNRQIRTFRRHIGGIVLVFRRIGVVLVFRLGFADLGCTGHGHLSFVGWVRVIRTKLGDSGEN